MKKKPHSWPTDGATMKYVDRVNDRLTMRIDKLLSRVRAQAIDLKELQSKMDYVMAFVPNHEDE